MNNETNNLGNQIPNNNQNLNMQNNGVNPMSQVNQPMNQQTINSNPINNTNSNPNPVYQSQMQQPSMNTMNSNPSYMNQPQMNPVNPNSVYQQPMYNQQPINNSGNKKNGKIFLFIGIGLVVVAMIIGIVVMVTGDKKNNSSNNNNNDVNDYEENNNQNPTPPVQEGYTYKEFEFNKVSGYTYESSVGVLSITNDNYIFAIEVLAINYNTAKSSYNELGSALTTSGYIVGDAKIATYSNVEVITYEVIYQNIKGLYFILASPNSSYVFTGMVANRSNTYNYSDINELIKITKDSKYTGNSSNYSNSFSEIFDINSIINTIKKD